MGMGYCYFAILYFTNICCASGLFPPDFRLPTFLTPNPLPSTNPLNGIQLLSSTPSSGKKHFCYRIKLIEILINMPD